MKSCGLWVLKKSIPLWCCQKPQHLDANINVSEILQLIENKGIFCGLSPCLALGIMEWWNIGMLKIG